MTDDRRREARARGFAAGMEQGRQAGDCPVGHDRLSERTAWMDGFGAARAEHPPAPSGTGPATGAFPLHEG